MDPRTHRIETCCNDPCREPAFTAWGACARCAIARAVGDGEHQLALDLADDAGILRSAVLFLIQREGERQARETARRLYARAS